jgi:SSS family solute:Na+ symporter
MDNTFQTLDWLVVGGYFAVLLGIAWWVLKQKQETTTDYFLAGRHVGWFVIGASIFASNIGSEHIVGLAGTGAKTGVSMGLYELHSWLALLLGWVFIPFYLRSRVFTMPEFLEKRYGPSARWFLSVIMLVGYVLTKVSVTVYAGAVVFQVLMGIDFWTGALVVVSLTGIYTILGGLRAVLYTETLQMVVLIAGSAIVTVLGLDAIGGWDNLVATAGSDHLNLFLPADHPEFPWPGMVFAPPIVGLWYWCTDQYIVQRALAGRDETQARRGTIWAAYLKLFPFFIFLIPGVIAFALARTGQLQLESADQAFPVMVKTLLPVGLRGLVAGGLLAALMSSLAAVFNSCSTLFTMDVYKKLRPEASGAVPLPAERAGLHRSANCRRVLFRALLEAPQHRGRHERHGRGIRDRHAPPDRGAEQRPPQRCPLLVRRRELPVLRRHAARGVCRAASRRQPLLRRTSL